MISFLCTDNKCKEGYSKEWILVVKNSIATIAPHYTMKRQLDDYYDKFYNKQAARFNKLSANDNALARTLSVEGVCCRALGFYPCSFKE